MQRNPSSDARPTNRDAEPKNTKHEETSQNYMLRKKTHSHVEAFPVLLMEFQAVNTECSELASLPPFSHAQLAHRDLILDQDSTPHLTHLRKGVPTSIPTPPSDPPRVTDHLQRTPALERPWARKKQGRLLLREIHRRLERLAFGRLAFGRRCYRAEQGLPKIQGRLLIRRVIFREATRENIETLRCN
jgi:hypothetical protein